MKIGPLNIRWERRSSLANPENWFIRWFAGGSNEAASGVNVTPLTAMQSSAVYACVRILAETVASLPLHIYRRLPGGGKERMTSHYLYPVLHDLPNPEMSSFELREALMGHLLLWGNAYAEIERDGAGRVRALWPLRPDRMVVERDTGLWAETDWDAGGSLRYRYTLATGKQVILPTSRVMHLRGLSFNGIIGYSPIRLAREAIGLSLATEEFGARFFGNGSMPGGVLEHPGQLGDQAAKHLRDSWEAMHKGLTQAHRVAILEEGMSWKQIGIPPEDAQFLETRKFQVTEIARIYRVPPHMLADLDRATFSNIEHQSIEFVMHSLRPWLVRWEQAIDRDLIVPEERSRIFAEHMVDALLRGDIKSRYEAYAVGRQNGWLSADDIREFENMNPLPDGQGKVYLVPLNMVPADSVTAPPKPAQGQASVRSLETPEERARRAAGSRRRLAKQFERLFANVEDRIVKREAAEVMRAAEKHLARRDSQTFDVWLQQFYEEHKDFMARAWTPVYLTYADAVQAEAADEIDAPAGMTPQLEDFVRAYIASHVALHAGSSLGQLRQVLREAAQAGQDEIEAVQQRLDEWKEKRPGKIALAETVQAANAVAREAYKANGVQKVRWVSFNPSCPYCSHLNGKVVGIESTFIPAGVDFQPEGAERPLTTTVDVRHPPGHQGCDCAIASA